MNQLYFLSIISASLADWIGAIGQCAGAAATFWAVTVALKESKKSRTTSAILNVKQDSIDFKWDFIIVNNGPIPIYLDDFVLNPSDSNNRLSIRTINFQRGPISPSDAKHFQIHDKVIVDELWRINKKGNQVVKYYFLDILGKKYKGEFTIDVPKDVEKN